MELLTDYRKEENEAQERESKKSPKMRQGSARGKGLAKKNPSRVSNLPNKRKQTLLLPIIKVTHGRRIQYQYEFDS